MMSRKSVSDTLLSVIMPAHNAETTVKKAAVTTLRAMPRDSELLVFLDACTDRTKHELSSISDPRLKLFDGTKQQGVAAALNVLLAEARGTYVARMDADDICLPWRFEKQTQKISKTNSDFLFGNAILFGASLKPLGFAPQLPFGLTAIQGRLALLLGNPFVHPTMIAKASSMRELGGYREVPAEDYDLWLRAGIAGMRIERSRSYDVLYRVHSRQLTQQAFWQQRLEQDTQLHETRATLSEQLLGASKEASADPLQIYRELWDANGGGIAVKWSIFRTLGTKSFFFLVKNRKGKSV